MKFAKVGYAGPPERIATHGEVQPGDCLFLTPQEFAYVRKVGNENFEFMEFVEAPQRPDKETGGFSPAREEEEKATPPKPEPAKKEGAEAKDDGPAESDAGAYDHLTRVQLEQECDERGVTWLPTWKDATLRKKLATDDTFRNGDPEAD